MLTMADEGGRGVGEMLTLADEGGRGVWTPPFLADIIFEQPLMNKKNNDMKTNAVPTLKTKGL